MPFLRGCCVARLGPRIHHPCGKTNRAGQAAELPLSTELLWEGREGGAGETGSGHWDFDSVFCSISAVELPAWIGAKLGAQAALWDGVSWGNKCWVSPCSCPQKEGETLPKGAEKHSQKEGETLPEGAGKHSQKEQELWEAGAAPLSRIQVISCVQHHWSRAGIPNFSLFFCACPRPSPPLGRLRAQHVASCAGLVTLL